MELIAPVGLPLALDPTSVAELIAAVGEALRAPAPVIALIGASDDTFCLGLSLDAAVEGAPATQAFADLLTTLHAAPKPLLAIVDGRAIGGGMGLACACDWVLATPRATFGLPELLWGLVPAIIWPVLTDRMPAHVARQWTIAAHTRSVEEARAAGLVDEIADRDLEKRTARRAQALARLDAAALVHLRRWSRESRQLDLPAALARGAAMTAAHIGEPRVRARWQAFTEGGTPWTA